MVEIRDTILSALEDGYYEVDLKGRMVYFNAAMAEVLGRTREQLGGLDYREFTDPEYWHEVFRIYNEVYRTGVSKARYFYVLLRPDGSRRQAHFSVHLMRDRAGEPSGFCGIVRDITEDEALRRTNETLRSISELVSGRLDLDDVLKHCCDAVVEQSVADRASIYLYQPDDESFRPVMSRGVRDAGLWDAFANQPPATAENSPAFGEVLRSLEPVIIEDAENTDRLRRSSVARFRLRSLVIYPLVARGEFVGVLVVDAFRQRVRFPPSEIDLMKQISRLLASAIHQAQLYDAVRAEAARFRMITTAMQDLVVVLTRDGTVEYASPSLEVGTGFPPKELVGRAMVDFIAPVDRKRVSDWFQEQVGDPDRNTGILEFRLVCADGEEIWVEATATAVRDGGGELRRVVMSGRVITERKRLEAELEQLAFYDTVTGLPNRALLMDRMEHALERARRGKARVALCFIDLDRFKEINDTLGHSVGDTVLREVAERLNACVRSGDTLARFGGDEFVLLVEGIEKESVAAEIVRRVVEALTEPLEVEGRELYVCASFGLAFSQAGIADADALLGDADIAMYKAKQDGGGRLVLASD